MWIFGYGSLVWKFNYKYDCRFNGYIKGYIRRFWQASEDHRGIPGKPGRVVTIIHTGKPEDVVWGVAYKIPDEEVETVVKDLDYREKDGYSKEKTMFYHEDEEHIEPFDITVFVANADNKWFVGEEEVSEIARRIAWASGPSGSNKEYLYNLADAMRNLSPNCHDQHLFQLEKAVREIVGDSHCESLKISGENLVLNN